LVVVLEIIIAIIALGVIATVVLQSGSSAGLSGSIAGGAESLFGKKKGMDEFLSKMTTWLGVAFFVVCLILAIIQ